MFDLIMYIQLMLNTIAVLYDFPQLTVNGELDEPTVRNLRKFQIINNIPPSGHVDKSTWNRLAIVYNALVNEQ